MPDVGACFLLVQRLQVVTAGDPLSQLAQVGPCQQLAQLGVAVVVLPGVVAGRLACLHLVGVETGMFADGFVEITGDGISEGLDVVIPR